jgi:hypothetical protein
MRSFFGILAGGKTRMGTRGSSNIEGNRLSNYFTSPATYIAALILSLLVYMFLYFFFSRCHRVFPWVGCHTKVERLGGRELFRRPHRELFQHEKLFYLLFIHPPVKEEEIRY